MKIALGLEYRGTRYQGWQRHPERNTIATCLEAALSYVADHPVTTVCAGRTDSGVHALQQVVHFETNTPRKLENWVRGANTILPPDIKVLWAREVAQDFSARFSAVARRYRYFIKNSPVSSALYHDLLTWYPHPLAIDPMQTAADYLIGEQDFSSFRSSACQSKSVLRRVYHLKVARENQVVIIDIKANAFLHHMVRNIVGVLLEIGRGKCDPKWMQEVLHACDRRAAATTAPPQGLYLIEVEYPAKWGVILSSSERN